MPTQEAPKAGKQEKVLTPDEVTGVVGGVTEGTWQSTYWRGADRTETAVQISRSDFRTAVDLRIHWNSMIPEMWW